MIDPKFWFSMRIHTTCWILPVFDTGGGVGAAVGVLLAGGVERLVLR